MAAKPPRNIVDRAVAWLSPSAAVKRAQRRAVLPFVARADERLDRLSLRQVEASVQECAARELPRPCGPRAEANRHFYQCAKQRRVAEGVDFNNVFAGI